MLVLSGGDFRVGGAQGTLMSRYQGWRGTGLDATLQRVPISRETWMGKRGWKNIGLIWDDLILCGKPRVCRGRPPLVVRPHLEVVPPLDMMCLLGAMVCLLSKILPMLGENFPMAAWLSTDCMAERCGIYSLKGEG